MEWELGGRAAFRNAAAGSQLLGLEDAVFVSWAAFGWEPQASCCLYPIWGEGPALGGSNTLRHRTHSYPCSRALWSWGLKRNQWFWMKNQTRGAPQCCLPGELTQLLGVCTKKHGRMGSPSGQGTPRDRMLAIGVQVGSHCEGWLNSLTVAEPQARSGCWGGWAPLPGEVGSQGP